MVKRSSKSKSLQMLLCSVRLGQKKNPNTKIKSVLLNCRSTIKNEQEKFRLIWFKASLSDSPRHCEFLK